MLEVSCDNNIIITIIMSPLQTNTVIEYLGEGKKLILYSDRIRGYWCSRKEGSDRLEIHL